MPSPISYVLSAEGIRWELILEFVKFTVSLAAVSPKVALAVTLNSSTVSLPRPDPMSGWKYIPSLVNTCSYSGLLVLLPRTNVKWCSAAVEIPATLTLTACSTLASVKFIATLDADVITPWLLTVNCPTLVLLP